ncbi:MAG: hypothetical protein AB7T49_09985 [Oligoflexales bacterium]
MAKKKVTVEHERRTQTRFELTGSLPGNLTSDSGDVYEAICVDVSKHGLGLLLDPIPKAGGKLYLDTPSGKLTFEIRWVSRQTQLGALLDELSSTCRVGLLVAGDTDLVQFLATFDDIQVGD